MPTTVNRFYKRLTREKKPGEGMLPGQRKRALTIPLLQGAQHQMTATQSQSAFFSNLPPEIRILIYAEVLKGEGESVVHVIKKPRKPLEFVKCKEKCAMEYNFRCWVGEVLDEGLTTRATGYFADADLLPLLQTCRKVYTEAIDTLYENHLFDFRSFDAFTILSLTLLPQRWNAIRRIHLKWHFGYELWCGQGSQRRKHDSTWNKVWKTMSCMQGLRDIQVDLDAYLETETLSPMVEADVLVPLMAITTAPNFVIKVSWPRGPEPSAPMTKTPYRLVRPANAKDAVQDRPQRAEAYIFDPYPPGGT